ncbi:MAG: hypothetical protein IPK95_05205 [Cellvibrionales bacterium]|nr:hypothetical protein [Cellvibrionales bacterium]
MPIDSIAADGVHITVAGKTRLVAADCVLVPDVYTANTALTDALQGTAQVVAAIGDCTGFGLIKSRRRRNGSNPRPELNARKWN